MLLMILIVKCLLCLMFLCMSNDATTEKAKKSTYTEEEEYFIIEEILNYPENPPPIHGSRLWELMEDKYREIHELDNTKLRNERTAQGMGKYFRRTMLRRKGKVELPDSLLELCKRKDNRRGDPIQEGNMVPSTDAGFNSEEDKFLMQKVLNYPKRPVPVKGIKIWRGAAKELREKRTRNPTQFPYLRTPDSLCSRFRKILRSMEDGPERDRIIQIIGSKDPRDPKGSGKTSSVDLGYNSEEDKLILEKVLTYPHRPVPVAGTKIWRKLFEELQEKRKLNPTEYPHVRTPLSLRSRFDKIVKSMVRGPDRDNFIQAIRCRDSAGFTLCEGSTASETAYNPEEDKFIINKVLSHPRIPVPVYGLGIWKEAAEELQEMRKLYPTQFPNVRTAGSLCSRFRRILKTMKNGPERDSITRMIKSKTLNKVDTVDAEFSAMEVDDVIADV